MSQSSDDLPPSSDSPGHLQLPNPQPVYFQPPPAYPQPYWVQPVYVARAPLAPYSTAAIAGFTLSLLWGLGLLSAVGLWLSIRGLRETESGRTGRGLAVAGIILGALGTAGLVGYGLLMIFGLLLGAFAGE